MSTSPQLVKRLHKAVRRCNRELAADAALKALLGSGVTVVTYGLLFAMGWLCGVFMARYLNLRAWQFGALLAGLFFIVAIWSAWRRVDPLAGLMPMTDQQWFLTIVTGPALGYGYFSPRHATAGAALVLIAGPAALLEALGTWMHRIRANDALIHEAATLLASCQTEFPAEQVREPTAALLLRRLHLIKVVPKGTSAALTITDKGFATLAGGKPRGAKRAAPSRESY